MANSSITCAPDAMTRSYYTRNGGTPITAINSGIASVTRTDADSLLAVAFTPTNTTVTINPGGEDSVAITNGTIRECCCVNGHNMASAYLFRAGARRLTGQTGAIVDQTVVFTINSVEVGRFTVLAVGAGSDEPVSGFIYVFSPTADTRFALATYNLVATVTAADSDLEIFVEIVGKD